MMEQVSLPTTAYDLLEPNEREAVDTYVDFIVREQRRHRQRIIHALSQPIPSEYVRRSKGVLAKPLARAAVAQKIKFLADEEDVSPDRVIREHAAIAFANIGDYLVVKEFGDFSVKSLDQIPRDALSAVKTMKTIPSPYGLRTEITLHDKHPSLKAMGELTGLVAPDQPAALREYVKPPVQLEQSTEVPETVYAKLLEEM